MKLCLNSKNFWGEKGMNPVQIALEMRQPQGIINILAIASRRGDPVKKHIFIHKSGLTVQLTITPFMKGGSQDLAIAALAAELREAGGFYPCHLSLSLETRPSVMKL